MRDTAAAAGGSPAGNLGVFLFFSLFSLLSESTLYRGAGAGQKSKQREAWRPRPGQASGAGRLASRRTAVSAAGRGSLVLPLAVTGTQ